MIKDILGEILDARKGKALSITINVEPENESENDELKKQGMAPVLESEGGDDKPDDGDEEALMNGEGDAIALKKKRGLSPRNLSERAKMMNEE